MDKVLTSSWGRVRQPRRGRRTWVQNPACPVDALQGMGIPVIPLGISIMRDILPRERLGSAIALMSSSLGVGGALGLPTSAAIAQHFGWHVLFWAATVLGGALALLIVVVVVMDFTAKIQAHLVSHQYDSLLKKANLRRS